MTRDFHNLVLAKILCSFSRDGALFCLRRVLPTRRAYLDVYYNPDPASLSLNFHITAHEYSRKYEKTASVVQVFPVLS